MASQPFAFPDAIAVFSFGKLGQVRALTLESIKVMLVDSTSAKFEWW